MVFIGCGGGGDSSSNGVPAPPVLPEASVSGSWNLYHTKTGGTEEGPDFFTLTDTGNSISGTGAIGSSTATITGTVSGMNITLSLLLSAGQTTSLTGTVSDDGSTMSGTYSNPTQSGIWRATRSAPLAAISVTPANASMAVGGTRQFAATGTYSDGTTNDLTAHVTWNSSNTSIATINNGGLATGVAQGTSTISATLGSISGSTTLTVTLTPAFSDGLDNWPLRTSGTTSALNRVTFGNGTFVAVGQDGTILTSTDGVTWTQRNPGTANTLLAATCGNGIFVAVGELGTVLTSPDGITWTSRNSGTSSNLGDVTYGNGTFAAVNSYGDILTSPDGVTWTLRYSDVVNRITGVTYVNNLFVAVGLANKGCDSRLCVAEPVILFSSDGFGWNQKVPQYNPPGPFSPVLYHVSYGNGIFLALSSGRILTSPDGVTWTLRYSWRTNLYGVTFRNGTFVAVGQDGTILTSTDGANWTQRNLSGPVAWLSSVTYGDGTFVAVGFAVNKGGVILQSEPAM